MKKLFLLTTTLLLSGLCAMQQPQEQNDQHRLPLADDATSVILGTPSQHNNRVNSPSPELYEIPSSQASHQTPATLQETNLYLSPSYKQPPLSPLISPERRQDRKREIENLSQTSIQNKDIQKHPRHETTEKKLRNCPAAWQQNSSTTRHIDNQPLFDAIVQNNRDFLRRNNKRFSVTKKNSQGNTPLHEAVRLGHREIVELLLEQGADPCEPNNDGLTSVDLARHIVETTQREIETQQDYDMYSASNCQPILDLLTHARACPSLKTRPSHYIPPVQQGQRQELDREASENHVPESSGSIYQYLSDPAPQQDAEKTGTSQEKK